MEIIETGCAIFGIFLFGYAVYNTGRCKGAKIAEEAA